MRAKNARSGLLCPEVKHKSGRYRWQHRYTLTPAVTHVSYEVHTGHDENSVWWW
jgi:hypothetical protein